MICAACVCDSCISSIVFELYDNLKGYDKQNWKGNLIIIFISSKMLPRKFQLTLLYTGKPVHVINQIE